MRVQQGVKYERSKTKMREGKRREFSEEKSLLLTFARQLQSINCKVVASYKQSYVSSNVFC